jgi:glycine hydroxymethyltransferase
LLMIDMSHIAGLVAGKAYPSPFLYADVVTTTVHKTLRGPRSALIFSRLDKKVVKYNKENKPVEHSLPDLIDKAIFPGLQGGPHENQIASVAVALKEASTPAFKKYAEQIKKNAKALSEELSKRGWRIISGGTDSHLVLVDTWMDGDKSKGGIGGGEASDLLEKNGIIVNKNAIPYDTRPPMDPSGIRLGTAAETTRGKKEKDMKKIAERIDRILRNR